MNSSLELVDLLTQQQASVILHSEKYYRFHMDSRNSSDGPEKKLGCAENRTPVH